MRFVLLIYIPSSSRSVGPSGVALADTPSALMHRFKTQSARDAACDFWKNRFGLHNVLALDDNPPDERH